MPAESAAIHLVGITGKRDVETRAFSGQDVLEGHLVIPSGEMVVGSVEVLRAVFRTNGVMEPEPLDYPLGLQPYCRRRLMIQTLAEAQETSKTGTVFVKPLQTKSFEARVVASPGDLEGLDPGQPVWVAGMLATPLQAEYRVYVLGGKIEGVAPYAGPDDLEDRSEPAIDMRQVRDALARLGPGLPRAYAMDWARTADGETALIECNDAWALGFYGGMERERYFDLLAARWDELVPQQAHEHTKREATYGEQ
ncbi:MULTISPECIES: ATP-grasp domain-containing protein [unclassified Thioalkalivibrio]|uniref:ATP-grasp domain-containing protein n=1 Tax=unclassified Thioalkalivibrio TaxID=2621013 RepID=UPI000381036B|nr:MULTISPECIES: ATP-grasp domain-containing protein [unclassified Thioalkalivibrio]